MVTFSAPKGVPDYFPPQSEQFLAVREAIAAPRDARATATSRRRSSRTPRCSSAASASPPTSSRKEMYTFTDRGDRSLTLRPEGTAGVLRAVARARPAPRAAAGEALVLRVRSSATSARRPAASGTSRRSAPRRSASTTRRSTPSCSSLAVDAYRDLGLTEVGCCSTRSATRPAVRPTASALQDVPARPRRSTRRPARAPRSTRCGCSTTSAPRSRRSSPTRRSWSTTLCDGLPRALRRGSQERLARAGRRLDRRAAAGPRARLLHAHHVRVPARRPRRAVRPSAAAVATTGCPSRSAARRCPASAGRSASTAPLLALEAEGVELGGAARVRRVRRAARRRGARVGASTSSPTLRRRGVAADHGVRRARAQGRDEGRRPLRCDVRRRRRRPRPRGRRRPGQGPAHRRADRGRSRASPRMLIDLLTHSRRERRDPHARGRHAARRRHRHRR